MKKISILMATLVAVLTLGSCKQNTEPCIQKATDFKLNTPALASQYYPADARRNCRPGLVAA